MKKIEILEDFGKLLDSIRYFDTPSIREISQEETCESSRTNLDTGANNGKTIVHYNATVSDNRIISRRTVMLLFSTNTINLEHSPQRNVLESNTCWLLTKRIVACSASDRENSYCTVLFAHQFLYRTVRPRRETAC